MIGQNLPQLDFDGKLLIEETTSGTVTTTYIGRAFYTETAAPTTSDPVWQILKYTSDTSNGIQQRFKPLSLTTATISMLYEFIWDNRASLTYL